jgi:organic hydroperoxide reductase OsmC/OhrA
MPDKFWQSSGREKQLINAAVQRIVTFIVAGLLVADQRPCKLREQRMPDKQHDYAVQVFWTGNQGTGTSSFRSYSRDHRIQATGKPPIDGSSDPSFRGDPARWNPEELLVASLAACHKLWYLSLCAEARIVVLDYEDQARGTMVEQSEGAGQFTSVVLQPTVTLAPGTDLAKAHALHDLAHEKCFIARSVNFPVSHEPELTIIANS